MAIHEKLKKIRLVLGLSQSDLAARMGVPISTIARIESGDVNISSKILEGFSRATGYTISVHAPEDVQDDFAKSDAFDVIAYLVNVGREILSDDYDITNLKLNKLLYYVQMFSVGKYGQLMFDGDMEAWKFGIVFPDIYHAFKDKRNQIITQEAVNGNGSKLPVSNRKLIREVFEKYGKLSAYELRDRTHREIPWRSVFKPDMRHAKIKIEDLKEEYRRMTEQIIV